MSVTSSGVALLLIIAASLVVGLLAAMWRLLRHRESLVGPINGVLALLTGIAAVVVLILHTFVVGEAFTSLDPVVVVAVLGLVELFAGLSLLLIERRMPIFAAERSFGLLSAGIGFLMVCAAFLIPILPGQFSTATVAALLHSPTRSVAVEAPTATLILRPTLTATWPPPTSLPDTPTPTSTRARFRTLTPLPTPTASVYCGGIVEYNLNMRAGPGRDENVLLLIPYRSIIQIGGTNGERTWWFVNYNDLWGWVDGQYVSVDTDCGQVPVLAD